MTNLLRVAVSKQKRRYQKNGYDLDLTYITDKVIAMGFPSEKVEGVYRNPMKEVVKFLDTYHKDHYKVYNLCSERDYDHSKFYGRVGKFPFDDHNAPSFEMIEGFCQDVDEYLKQDSKNIVVIHCKAGKGRTGTMICAYLLYCGMWQKTEDSLSFYAALRTYNQKGVTIPSQIRYVHYYGRALRESIKYSPRTLLLRKVLLKPLPKEVNLSDIIFNISVGKTTVYHSKDALNVTIHRVAKKKKSKKISKEKSNKDLKSSKNGEQPTTNSTEETTSTTTTTGVVDNQTTNNNNNNHPNGGSAKSTSHHNTYSSQTMRSNGTGYGTISGGSSHGLHNSMNSSSNSNITRAQSTSVFEYNSGTNGATATNNTVIGSDNDEYIAFDIGSLPLVGDIKIDFSDKSKGERMFMFWINTSFVSNHEIVFKHGLDKAHKDKKIYPEDFRVELFFEELEPTTTVGAAAGSSSIEEIQTSTTSSSSSSSSSPSSPSSQPQIESDVTPPSNLTTPEIKSSTTTTTDDSKTNSSHNNENNVTNNGVHGLIDEHDSLSSLSASSSSASSSSSSSSSSSDDEETEPQKNEQQQQ
eukprot:gene1377-1740_t